MTSGDQTVTRITRGTPKIVTNIYLYSNMSHIFAAATPTTKLSVTPPARTSCNECGNWTGSCRACKPSCTAGLFRFVKTWDMIDEPSQSSVCWVYCPFNVMTKWLLLLPVELSLLASQFILTIHSCRNWLEAFNDSRHRPLNQDVPWFFKSLRSNQQFLAISLKL